MKRYQKEADLARVRQEIGSLTIAPRLLADDDSSSFDTGRFNDELTETCAECNLCRNQLELTAPLFGHARTFGAP